MKTVPYMLRTTLILLLTPAAALAADEQWQVGSAPSFSSGKYGTDSRTEVFYTPVTARRLFSVGDLTVVFPFTCIRGDGTVTVVDGSPTRTDLTRTGGTSTDGTATRTGTTTTSTRTGTETTSTAVDASSGAGALAPRSTACGAGDVVVRGRYYVLDERAWWPTIALRAHVKAPTADADKGLGTGRPDEGAGIEISRMLGGGFMTMVDAGYTVIGKPAGAEFRNSWWYDVGVGQDLAGGAVNLSVFFEEYSAIVPGLDNAREVLAAVTMKGAGGWRLQVSGEFGLSDGAPDHGLTFGASRRF